eukprot:COSAG02_NODE_525_length_20713_cov_5.808286_9_plen_83_part_00
MRADRFPTASTPDFSEVFIFTLVTNLSPEFTHCAYSSRDLVLLVPAGATITEHLSESTDQQLERDREFQYSRRYGQVASIIQ